MGCTSIEWPEGEIDEKTVTVLQALRDEKRFVFDYDFGDNWEHDVVVEELTWSYFGLKYAVVLDGENACPPDDVGGAPGYGYFLEASVTPPTRSTRTTSSGSVAPSTPPSSTWPEPTPSARRCADQPFVRVPRRAFVERSRKLSVPVSMMWALKVSRSTMAATRPGVADHLTPLGERQVGGGGHRGLLLPLGEDLEHQLCPSGVELHVAEFVKAQQVEASIAGDQAGQPPFVGRLDQFVHQGGTGRRSGRPCPVRRRPCRAR